MVEWSWDEEDRTVGPRSSNEIDDELIVAADPEEQRTHDGMPISGYWRGEPIPDLNALPRERWQAALRPLSPFTRRMATSRLARMEDVTPALIILGELLISGDAARDRALDAAPPRLPAGALPARSAGHQVNFRLGPTEHARLLEVARMFAMRPTTLARVLTVRGVDRALYEARRDETQAT